MIDDDCITSCAWVSSINCVRLVFVLICCCTLANCTSSLVNWFASIGLLGSWFCNCVISKCRKSPKLDDSEASAVLELLEPAAATELAAAVDCCAAADAMLMAGFLKRLYRGRRGAGTESADAYRPCCSRHRPYRREGPGAKTTLRRHFPSRL